MNDQLPFQAIGSGISQYIIALLAMDNIQEFNEDTLKYNVISQRSPVSGHTIFYVNVYK